MFVCKAEEFAGSVTKHVFIVSSGGILPHQDAGHGQELNDSTETINHVFCILSGC